MYAIAFYRNYISLPFHANLSYWRETALWKRRTEKKIVQVKKCGSSSQGASYGVIEERNTGNTINITFRGDERKVYRYDRMAMLVERDDIEFFLIPTMEAERDSNQEKNSES